MKKTVAIVLIFTIVFLFCGCSKAVDNNTHFSQQVTVVILPSPPKCKTTNDAKVINEIINVLGQIEKTPNTKDTLNGGWNIMIKLDIDDKKFNYTLGGVFTDSDGKQYYVENQKEIEEKLLAIYDKIDAPEVDYP